MSRAPTKGEKTKEMIAQAAIALFAERGVDATSIRDIANAVGVTEPAIYRHYESKAAMVRDLFVEHYQALAQVLDTVQTEQKDAQSRVQAMVGAFCDLFDERPALFRFLLMAQHRALSDSAELRPNPVDMVRSVLADAIAAKALPPQDPDIANTIMFGIVLQAATFKIYGRLDQPLAAYREELSAAIWAALSRAG